MSPDLVEFEDRRVDRKDGWSVRFYAPLHEPGQLRSGYAELYRDGKLVCGITVAKLFERDDAMLDALHGRPKAWIDDWNSRSHTGNTTFGIL